MISSNRLFQKFGAKTPVDRQFAYNRRKLAPMVEVFESRELLNGAWAGGFLTGTVFNDANKDATLDKGDAYLSGATVQLFKSGCNTPIATQVTGCNGQYDFTNLSAGNYLIETAPCGYTSSGTQVLSQLNPAASVASNMIAATVVNPSSVYINYDGVAGGVSGGQYVALNVSVDGTATANAAGPLSLTLGSSAGATDINSGYNSFCVNDQESINFSGGQTFQVTPQPITTLSNNGCTISSAAAGRIAYLYNHYGNSSLTGDQAAGLQLAIWELLYDGGSTPNFSAGNFQVTSPYGSTSQTDFNAAIADATWYYNDSAGQNETAVFLNAANVNCGSTGFQSQLATCSLNFANVHNNGCGGFGSGSGFGCGSVNTCDLWGDLGSIFNTSNGWCASANTGCGSSQGSSQCNTSSVNTWAQGIFGEFCSSFESCATGWGTSQNSSQCNTSSTSCGQGLTSWLDCCIA